MQINFESVGYLPSITFMHNTMSVKFVRLVFPDSRPTFILSTEKTVQPQFYLLMPILPRNKMKLWSQMVAINMPGWNEISSHHKNARQLHFFHASMFYHIVFLCVFSCTIIIITIITIIALKGTIQEFYNLLTEP